METGERSANQPFVFSGDRIELSVDLRLYRLVAIQKTGYRIAAQCTVVLGEEREGAQRVTLVFAPGIREGEALQTARLFHQELLDQELREKVGEETAALRALILAHAFSRTSLPTRG